MFSLLERLAHLYHPRSSNRHRPRVLHPEAFVFYVLILLGVAGLIWWAPQPSSNALRVLGFASAITPEQVIEQTNQARRVQGLPELTYSATLSQAAQHKGQDMLASHYWAHVSPAGKTPWAFMAEAGYHYRVAGENLARDFSNTPDMIQAWLNSPSHRANLLNNRYTEIGVAVVPGKLDTYDTTVVIQMFGTPKTQPQALVQKNEPEIAVAGIAAQPNFPTPGVPTLPPLATHPAVLASAIFPLDVLSKGPILSPRLLLTTISFAFVVMLMATLLYDWLWFNHQRPTGIRRLVGKNWAHLLYLLVIALLMALYKDGRVS